MSQFTKFSAALLASAIAAAAPAAAAVQVVPIKFDLRSNNANNNVSDGNARTFSASTAAWGAFNVRATGWSLEIVGNDVFVRDSKLVQYDAGLGVISGDDGDGSGNRHTVDNQTRYDFITLQFDRNVALTEINVNAYGLNGATDTDALIAYGTTATAWNSSLGLNDAAVSVLAAKFSGSFTSLGTSVSGARAVNSDLKSGNLWLIGADFTNADHKTDSFKLAGFNAVPEPATWAMMIGGFGVIGAASRRRRRRRQVVSYS